MFSTMMFAPDVVAAGDIGERDSEEQRGGEESGEIRHGLSFRR
jgi:hypothetical protein